MALIIRCIASQRSSPIAFAFAAALVAPLLAQAEDHSAASPPPAGTEDVPAVPAASAQNLFGRAELERLLTPIALYPDALLAQLLAASAYPLQIVEAQRWLDKNKGAVADKDFSGIDSRDWDPAVKAMARFPDVIEKMSDDLEWTRDLGDAEVNQPQDVADVIQELRAEAENAGALKTSPQETVSSVLVDNRPYIVIEPAELSILYVPSYEPAAVYQPIVAAAPVVTFGVGIFVGTNLHQRCWNWRTGAIYPPAWAGYPDRGDGQPLPAGGNTNVGNKLMPWRPGPDYRPRLGAKSGVHASASVIVDRSPDGTTITIRGSNTIDRQGNGNSIANTRSGTGNFVDTRPAGNFVDTRPGGNFVSSRSGAGNFVSARPAAGNFVNTNSRPAVGITGDPDGVNVINRAPGLGIEPRAARVAPNFSQPLATSMSGIKPGVGPIPFNRAVIDRGRASGRPVGGAVARPGGFGGGGIGGALR
jgi:hypothetical protein